MPKVVGSQAEWCINTSHKNFKTTIRTGTAERHWSFIIIATIIPSLPLLYHHHTTTYCVLLTLPRKLPWEGTWGRLYCGLPLTAGSSGDTGIHCVLGYIHLDSKILLKPITLDSLNIPLLDKWSNCQRPKGSIQGRLGVFYVLLGWSNNEDQTLHLTLWSLIWTGFNFRITSWR